MRFVALFIAFLLGMFSFHAQAVDGINSTSGALPIGAGGNKVIWVLPEGRVGIGKEKPDTVLDVDGATKSTTMNAGTYYFNGKEIPYCGQGYILVYITKQKSFTCVDVASALGIPQCQSDQALSFNGKDFSCITTSTTAKLPDVSCPSGQALSAIVNGVAKCSTINGGGPGTSISATCPAGEAQAIYGIDGNSIKCTKVHWSYACPTGSYVSGFSNGVPTCHPGGTSDTVTSCVDAYCEGTGGAVFPVRNTAGSQNEMPAICDGTWYVDTRGANFQSGCKGNNGFGSGFWTFAVNCNDANGYRIPGCPDLTPKPGHTVQTCYNAECSGYNTTLKDFYNGDYINGGSKPNRSGGYRCDGKWHMDVRGSLWTSECDPPGWYLVK